MADGWVPSVGNMSPEGLRKASARIDEAALAAGRDPGAIRRVYNIGPFEGPVEQWVEMLAMWATELGVDAFVYWPADTGTDVIHRLATEVAPAVRSALGVK
jgi:hypothetical protein